MPPGNPPKACFSSCDLSLTSDAARLPAIVPLAPTAASPVWMHTRPTAARALRRRVWVGAAREQGAASGSSLERIHAGVVQPRLGEIKVDARAIDRPPTVAAGGSGRLRSALQAFGAVDLGPVSAESVSPARAAAALGGFDLVGQVRPATHACILNVRALPRQAVRHRGNTCGRERRDRARSAWPSATTRVGSPRLSTSTYRW